jgi:NAD(P)H-hydrate epimerase
VVGRAIPVEEVRVLDINAEHLGVRTIGLMERAGAAVAAFVSENNPPDVRIAVVCGKGNNGGDGFVAARYLARRLKVCVFLVEHPDRIQSDLSRTNLDLVRDIVKPAEAMDAKQFDVIVDAMLGIGLTGRPREPYASMIKAINSSRRQVVSVDVPSGWPSDLQVRPHSTVTFHAPKVGMTKKNSGRMVVADIGIPKDAETYCGPGEFSLVPPRKKDAHKGDAGRVLVIGGGPYTGAPAFAGMAAMRSGVDLTFVATPEPSALPVSIYSPNMIVHPLPGEVVTEKHLDALLAWAKEADAVAIGPGLGSAKETISAVQRFVQRCDTPMVVDADAIGACGQRPQVLRRKRAVVTPHAGEFKKLTGKTVPDDPAERIAVVEEAAAGLGVTIVLKGPVDVISDGEYTKLNRTGNSAMTVGGTGDVLTGVIAGIMAQGATPFAAARVGTFAAGVAGDLAFEEKSFGLLATDVIDKVPFVIRRYLLASQM